MRGSIFLARGEHPNSLKNTPRMRKQVTIFHVGSYQFRESLRELLRELWLSYCSSREMPFREWKFVFRDSVSEFRELLREYPGTLRELRKWPFHSESVFPEIGVVPTLVCSRDRREITSPNALQEGSNAAVTDPLEIRQTHMLATAPCNRSNGCMQSYSPWATAGGI